MNTAQWLTKQGKQVQHKNTFLDLLDGDRCEKRPSAQDNLSHGSECLEATIDRQGQERDLSGVERKGFLGANGNSPPSPRQILHPDLFGTQWLRWKPTASGHLSLCAVLLAECALGADGLNHCHDTNTNKWGLQSREPGTLVPSSQNWEEKRGVTPIAVHLELLWVPKTDSQSTSKERDVTATS